MNPSELLLLAGGLVAGVVSSLIGYSLYLRARRRTATLILLEAETKASATLKRAGQDADQAKSAAVLEGKMEVLRLREEGDRDLSRRREEADRAEHRAEDRERGIVKRGEQLEQQEKSVVGRLAGIERQELAIKVREAEVDVVIREQHARLERVAGLTAEEAKRELLQKVEDEARAQAGALGREIREQAKKDAEKDAKKIIALAVQRLAAEHTAETTVSAVALPSDEMKGRIIGREGRNIRAFEQVTGVDLIIDDTPDTVIVSCFDPIRREVGRRALEALIVDGRIHPGRIEEIVKKIRTELESQLVELGEQAAFETGIHGLHPEMIRLIGRMRYRTSYGQNIYDHSKEVAWLAGMMAAELGLDVALAKRGGLLHDVGKVLTHESEGTHVELGVEMARKYRETGAVIGIIAAHHDDVPHESIESVLVQAADAISGARPGARREAFETYVKRLTKLEEIAAGFEGVEKTNVIQAGREVRVIVVPERIDDAKAAELAETIARKIESELQYPGQIKVTVIRETRAVGLGPMTAWILDGAAIAKEIRQEIARDVAELAGKGVTPGLAVVIVGEDPASQVYVKAKGQACREAGMHSETIVQAPATASEAEVLSVVDQLNANPAIHGFLVQLPLPRHVDSDRVLNRISPTKDVDGFHPVNVGKLSVGDPTAFRPATPFGVQQMLVRSGIETKGAHAVIVGRSNIVGKPMASLFLQDAPGGNATVTVCHSRSRDLPGITRQADILVVAIGKPRFVTGDMVRKGAVVIDVGINRVSDPAHLKGYRIEGDVDYTPVAEVASAITPVPGGVGKMTIAMLLANTLQAARGTVRTVGTVGTGTA